VAGSPARPVHAHPGYPCHISYPCCPPLYCYAYAPLLSHRNRLPRLHALAAFAPAAPCRGLHRAPLHHPFVPPMHLPTLPAPAPSPALPRCPSTCLRGAGVPLRRMVAGVAMGLILEPDGRFVVLTDILGSGEWAGGGGPSFVAGWLGVVGVGRLGEEVGGGGASFSPRALLGRTQVHAARRRAALLLGPAMPAGATRGADCFCPPPKLPFHASAPPF